MKKYMTLLALMPLLLTVGCKKESTYTSNNTATIAVINGVITEDVNLKMNGSLNSSGATSSWSQETTSYFGTTTFFYVKGNQTPIEILRTNSNTSLFSSTYDFKGGGIYTLLLAGVSPNVEAVLIEDTNMPTFNLSKIPTESDSAANVRFINLSPDVQPLTVRLRGNVDEEFGGLAYKGYTPFKKYTLKSTAPVFEILENGVVIATRNVPLSRRFRNVAVVLTGLKNNSTLFPRILNYFQ